MALFRNPSDNKLKPLLICISSFLILSHSTTTCYDVNQCKLTTITDTSSISCYGVTSCHSSIIHSGYSTYCYGQNSCLNSSIHSDMNIWCDGSTACSKSKLYALDSNVYCRSANGCQSTEIITNHQVYGYGAYSIQDGQIYAPMVKGYGYYSLMNAKIYSQQDMNLRVEMYGYSAGYNAFIFCMEGSVCTVACESNGCFKLTMVCSVGSECHVIPSECERNQDELLSVDGIICPVWSNHVIDEGVVALIDGRKGENVLDVDIDTNNNNMKNLKDGVSKVGNLSYTSLIYTNLITAILVFWIGYFCANCKVIEKVEETVDDEGKTESMSSSQPISSLYVSFNILK